MISKIQRDFLMLFKCIIDFGGIVYRKFTEERIADNFPNGFGTAFLKSIKHHFYHQWNKEKKSCCECPPAGCNIPKTGKMDFKTFTKYFVNVKSRPPKGHLITNGKDIIQTCICQYTEQNITIGEIELCDINVLLQNLNIIYPNFMSSTEKSLLKELLTLRGKVCHAVSTETFTKIELNTLWSTFTNVVYGICPRDKSYVVMLQKAVEATKKNILDEAEVTELMEKIDTVINIADTNMEAIKNLLKDETTEIKAHVDEKLQTMAEQQIAYSELLQRNVFQDIAREGLTTRAHVNHVDKQLKAFFEGAFEDFKKQVKGTSTDNDQEEENDCSSCYQKDIQIKKLEKINNKFKERKWIFNRFLSQPDPEEISDEDSDYMSDHSSGIEIEELTDEQFTENSDYITCPSSVKLESAPIQCYVGNSFESSLEKLRLMMMEQNLDGREKLRIQIIFKEERDMKWTTDILSSFKEENNDCFSGIEFFHVSSINKG